MTSRDQVNVARQITALGTSLDQGVQQVRQIEIGVMRAHAASNRDVTHDGTNLAHQERQAFNDEVVGTFILECGVRSLLKSYEQTKQAQESHKLTAITRATASKRSASAWILGKDLGRITAANIRQIKG